MVRTKRPRTRRNCLNQAAAGTRLPPVRYYLNRSGALGPQTQSLRLDESGPPPRQPRGEVCRVFHRQQSRPPLLGREDPGQRSTLRPLSLLLPPGVSPAERERAEHLRVFCRFMDSAGRVRSRSNLAEHFPGRWTGRAQVYLRDTVPQVVRSIGNFSDHYENIKNIRKIPKSCWPSGGGIPAWPSSPTVEELLANCPVSKGFTLCQQVPQRPSVKISLGTFNSSKELIVNIVHRHVIGVRSWVPIPKRYRGYFRYRWNVCVLTAPYLPIGLARFLASIWLCKPSNLWLDGQSGLKKFLRQVPLADVIRSARRDANLSELLCKDLAGGSRHLPLGSDMSDMPGQGCGLILDHSSIDTIPRKTQ